MLSQIMKSQNLKSFKVYDNIGRPKDAHCILFRES